MSTFIKVTQEGSRLLQLNAQQTQAARLAKLEGDEQRRTERQAREARRAALLQQGLDASGNAFGDLRRRRFRLDEPAATPPPIGGLVISWIGNELKLSNPKASVSAIDNAGLKPSTLQSFGSVAAVETFDTSPPEGFDNRANGTYVVDLQSRITEYTLETWGEVAQPSGEMIVNTALDLTLWLISPGLGSHFLRVNNYPGGLITESLSLSAGVYCNYAVTAIGQATFERVAISLSGNPVHLCIQRIGVVVFFYVNGSLVGSLEDATVYPSVSILNAGSTTYYTSVYRQGPPAKLGQTRFTPERARYPQAGFTPNPLPFR